MATTETPEFVIHDGRRARLVSSFSAHYAERRRDSGKRIMGMPVLEWTGTYDKSRIGILSGGVGRTGIPATAAGVKKHLRRIRPQELERIQALDEEIRMLSRKRAALIREAFTRGHVVTLAEVKAKADANAELWKKR